MSAITPSMSLDGNYQKSLDAGVDVCAAVSATALLLLPALLLRP